MRVFLTGAAGYIGGAVARRLIADGATVHGLIRDAAKADAIATFGILPVVGSLDDEDLLRFEAGAADAVINVASSDHRASIETFLHALEGSGKVFLHTSGSSLVGDDAYGEPSARLHRDDEPLEFAPHRANRAIIDQMVLNAHGVRSAVLCNALVYGDVVAMPGESVLVGTLARTAMASGRARYVGRGLNRWSSVEVSDAADLYALALAKVPANSFLFVESGEDDMQSIAQSVSDRFGLEPATGTTREEAEVLFGKTTHTMGMNSRVRGLLARQLGWKPKNLSITDWLRAPSSSLTSSAGVIRQLTGN